MNDTNNWHNKNCPFKQLFLCGRKRDQPLGGDLYQAASPNEGVSHSAKFKTEAFNSIFVSWISTKKEISV